MPYTSLLDGEKILHEYKPSRKSSLAFGYIGGSLVTLAGIAITLGGLVTGGLTLAASFLFSFTGVMMGIGLSMLISSEISTRGWTYYITDQRVIKEFVLLKTDTKSARFDRIAHVSPDQGLLDRLFGAGSVSIKTAGTSGTDFRLKHISKWRQAEQDVSSAMNNTQVNRQSQGRGPNPPRNNNTRNNNNNTNRSSQRTKNNWQN